MPPLIRASLPSFVTALPFAVICTLALLQAVDVQAQNYPQRPVRLLAPEPGGGSDFVARVVAQGLSATLGQQVIVDNRGITAIDLAARAVPDGHTLLIYSGPFWLLPFMRANLTWDPVRDFTPVMLVASSPNVLAVHPSLPVTSVRELIALARARPGELNYSSGSTGTIQHLAAELFKSMAKTNIVRIPYKGTGPALSAVIGGQVQIMFPNAGAVMSHLKSGRLRALAVTTPGPTTLVPGLPTVAAAGLPGYEAVSPFGAFAPAQTPATLVSRLNHEIARVLETAEAKKRLFDAGIEGVGGPPELMAATMRAEMNRLGKLITEAGLHE